MKKSTTSFKALILALKASLLAIALSLFNNSCLTQAPKPIKPDRLDLNLPHNFTSQKKSQSVSSNFRDYDWLKEIGGNQLKNLVKQAFKKNPSIDTARARIEQALANAYINGAERLPIVNFNTLALRSKQNFIGFPITTGGSGIATSRTNTFGISFDASWELDLWGRLLAKQKASLATYQAAVETTNSALLSLAGQVAKAYIACIVSTKQVELAKEALATNQKTEESIRDSFGVDSATSQLRLAMSDVESAKASLESYKLAQISTIRQLQALLGQYPSGELDEISLPALLPKLPKPPPAGLPSQLLSRRPDLISAERQVASADMSLREAKLTLLPRISLTGNYGTSTDELKNILNKDYNVWNIAGNLIQPVLAGGAIKAGILSRKGSVKLALANYKQVAISAFGEVENALTAESYLKKQESALSNALSIAKDAYEGAQKDFTEGTSDRLTILTAQNRYIALQTQLLTLQQSIIENRINVHMALGGDFILRDNLIQDEVYGEVSAKNQTNKLRQKPKKKNGWLKFFKKKQTN